jgi:hypothetical protein
MRGRFCFSERMLTREMSFFMSDIGAYDFVGPISCRLVSEGFLAGLKFLPILFSLMRTEEPLLVTKQWYFV